jgi:hypothetical protein
VSGTNRAIGAVLADHAARHFGTAPDQAGPTTTARASILAEVAPHILARAEGVRERFPDADPFGLPFLMDGPPAELPAACSVALLPRRGARGPWLVRNFDFGFLSASALTGGPGTGAPMVSAPHVLSLSPDDGGYPTLGVSVFDLFGGLTDGVNAQGLGVALLQHIDGARLLGPPGAFNEVELVRLLLETCATADEARAALAGLPRATAWLPCRYLVADAAGHGFVWSESAEGATVISFDDRGYLVATNHDPGSARRLSEDPSGATANDLRSSEERLAALSAAGRDAEPWRVADAAQVLTFDERGSPVGGTIWSAVYDLGQRELGVRFLAASAGGRPAMGPELEAWIG